MLRSVIVVLIVGMVVTSSGCLDIHMTFELPAETCLAPSPPEAEVLEPVREPSPEQEPDLVLPPRLPWDLESFNGGRGTQSAANGAGEWSSTKSLPTHSLNLPIIDIRLRELRPSIFDCFQKYEREADPGLEGTLTIEFELGDDTVIPPVEPSTTWDASERFTTCIERLVEDADFSGGGDGRVVKAYDLE